MTTDDIADNTRAQHRRRARQACAPCKLRKRRCDGLLPCGSCRQYDYDCHYSVQHRRRSAKVAAAAVATETPSPTRVKRAGTDIEESPSERADDQSIEANSGVAFPKVVGVGLDPFSASKLEGLGCGLGLRPRRAPCKDSITWIISKAQWAVLLATYTQKIHSVYSFLDLKVVTLHSITRWDDANADNSYDHVLCGIAALASFFTPNSNGEQEQALAECARAILDSTSLVTNPTAHDAQAWVLRVLYARCNETPHAAWMVSGITMQIMEAAGLHKEESDGPGQLSSSNRTSNIDIECLRKTFWLAKMQNTWTSSEYGRSPIQIIGITCPFPKHVQGDQMSGFVAVLQLGMNLRPDRKVDAAILEKTMREVNAIEFDTDPLFLSKTNFCFTTYRRLRLVVGRIKQDLLDIIISVGRKGLQAALRLVQSWCPWWNVLNVPFQFCCVLLAIDTPQSLSHVHEALAAIRVVADTFNTSIVRKALSTVEQLVQMAFNRKQHDLNALGGSLTRQGGNEPGLVEGAPQLGVPGDALLSNDFLWASPNVQNVNWDQFWDAAFPVNMQDQALSLTTSTVML